MAFKWFDSLKPITSLFIGTSPEFEMALYTVVHVMGYSDVEFKLLDKLYKVKCFGFDSNANKKEGVKPISSCFPVRRYVLVISSHGRFLFRSERSVQKTVLKIFLESTANVDCYFFYEYCVIKTGSNITVYGMLICS